MKNKKIILLITISIFSITASFAQADSLYSQSLKKMFALSGSEETFKGAITQMVSMFKQQNTNIDSKIWDELEAEFSNSSMNDLVDMLIPVYSKYLSQSDIEAMITFYQSPIGEKFAKSTPMIMKESMQVGQQWGMKISQEFTRKLEEKK